MFNLIVDLNRSNRTDEKGGGVSAGPYGSLPVIPISTHKEKEARRDWPS